MKEKIVMALDTYFIGICTHVLPPFAPAPVPHRCVLYNGVIPSTIHGATIPSHIALLFLAADEVVDTVNLRLPEPDESGLIMWQLPGVRMRIRNAAAGETLTYDASFTNCIPSLQALAPDLGPASEVVVDGDDAHIASCYFDATAGTFFGGVDVNGAATAKLHTEITGGGDALVEVTSFVFGTSGMIVLRPDAEMYVTNFGTQDDGDADFLLHYRVAQQLPAVAGVPGLRALGNCPSLTPRRVITAADIGPGCSNSTYP